MESGARRQTHSGGAGQERQIEEQVKRKEHKADKPMNRLRASHKQRPILTGPGGVPKITVTDDLNPADLATLYELEDEKGERS